MRTRRLAVHIILWAGLLAWAGLPAAYAQKNLPKAVESVAAKSVRQLPAAALPQTARKQVPRLFTPKPPRTPTKQQILSYIPAELSTPQAPVVKTEKVISAAANGHMSHRRDKKWMTISPREKADQLLAWSDNPIQALQKMWRIRKFYKNRSFFSYLATAFYKQNFPMLTPHLKEFFKKIERLDDYRLQMRVLKRMSFISQNKDQFRAYFSPNIPKSGLRLRYTKDISQLTPENYSPKNLVLSFERKMNPGQFNASIRHVKVNSRFPVGKTKSFPVYQYNGPLEFIPNLYLYLINGNHPKNRMTLVFDKENRSLAIYNEDRSLWLRITPHEYADPSKLHLHLNETRTAQLKDAYGRVSNETVNYNLYIPLARPATLPAHQQQEYLYEMLILKPLRYFQGNDHVTIVERSIF